MESKLRELLGQVKNNKFSLGWTLPYALTPTDDKRKSNFVRKVTIQELTETRRLMTQSWTQLNENHALDVRKTHERGLPMISF